MTENNDLYIGSDTLLLIGKLDEEDHALTNILTDLLVNGATATGEITDPSGTVLATGYSYTELESRKVYYYILPAASSPTSSQENQLFKETISVTHEGKTSTFKRFARATYLP